MIAPANLDLRGVFEATPDPALLLLADAPRFTVAAASDAYLKAEGLSRQDLLGEGYFDNGFHPGSHAERFEMRAMRGSFERVIRTGAPDVLSACCLTAQAASPGAASAQRWWRPMNAPITDSSGRVVYVLHRLDDVTDFVLQARRQKEWAAFVAHELLQPINILSGYAQLLSRVFEGTLDRAMATKYLEKIQRAGDLLGRMTHDLEDTSSIDAGKLSIDCRDIDVAAVVRGAVDGLPHLAGNVEFGGELNTDTRVWADPDRLEQVLGHLLRNAARYRDPGTFIRVNLAQSDSSVHISVENTGRDVTADQLLLALESGPQHPRRNTELGRALGLSLYVSKALVEAHGGRLWADRAPGALTRFHLTIPLSEMRRSAPPRVAQPAATPRGIAYARQPG